MGVLDETVNTQDDWGWRFVIWVQIIPGAMLLVGMLFAPQSPRWLVLKGRVEEAKETLRGLRPTQAMADDEFQEVQASLRDIARDSNDNGPPSIYDTLRTPYMRKMTGLGMVIQLLQQLCG